MTSCHCLELDVFAYHIYIWRHMAHDWGITVLSTDECWCDDSVDSWLWLRWLKVKEGAMSTFSPVGSRSSNGMRMCVCVCTEWTWSMHYAGISTAYQFIPYYVNAILYTQAHAHTHPQTIWGQQTDGANSGYCQRGFLYPVSTVKPVTAASASS